MNTATVKNWSIATDNNGFTAPELTRYILQGNIYDDSRRAFPDGTPIYTSSIRSITDCSTHKLVETRNTVYTVCADDVDPGYEEAYPGAYERLRMRGVGES